MATVLVGTPLVPVDTAAEVCETSLCIDALDGIAIGYHPAEEGDRPPQGPNERFFQLNGGPTSGNALQLVVLDRRTLETVESWSGPPSLDSIATLTDKLKGYKDNRLAIVTAWYDLGWVGVVAPTQKLTDTPGKGVNLIGAAEHSLNQIWQYGLEFGGQLSWIGVPGFPAGEAWEVAGGFQESADPELASLQGFLSPDSNENYAYMGTTPATFDLGPDGQSVSMTIGSNEFSASLPDGQGGFLVAYLRGTTLEPANNVSGGKAVYVTRNADGSPNYDGIADMTGDIKRAYGVGRSLVVAIRSIGPAPLARIGQQPPDYQGSFDQQYADALNNLVPQINQVGGHGQLFWGMATNPTGHDSFSLLGNTYAANQDRQGEGTGASVGSQLKPQGQSRLSGILARDKQSRYVPKVTATDQVGGALAEVAVAEPTEWPHSSTPGELAALACIGQAQGLGPDPRVAYWLQTYSESKWLQTKDDIEQMQPSACSEVDATDFTAVRDELVTEIGWLINVNSYTDALTHPFTSDGLSSFADLQSITEAVVREADPPASKQTGIDGFAIIGDVSDLLDALEVPGAGAVGAVFFLIDDLTASGDDGPTIDWGQRVEAGAAQVGEALAEQLSRIAAGNEQLADIVAADYGKLSTVGRLGQCTPGDSGCTPEWQFTQPQQNAASRMYEITAKRQIWGGVLPAGYPFVLYVNSNQAAWLGKYPRDQINNVSCVSPKFPVLTPVFLRYAVMKPGVSDTRFLVFSQRNITGSFAPDPNWSQAPTC